MAAFWSQTAVGMIRRAVRRVLGSPIGQNAGPEVEHCQVPYPMIEVAFELDATLTEGTSARDTGANAHPRDWDPSLNSNKGQFVTDESTTFTVRDIYEVGFYGSAGAKGRCHIMFALDGSKFGAITDMECP